MISNSGFDSLGLVTSLLLQMFYLLLHAYVCCQHRFLLAVSFFLRFAGCIVEGGVGGEQFLRPFSSENLTLLCFTLSCH